MDKFILQIAAMAAKSNFSKTEFMGHYHNEALFYVTDLRKNTNGTISPLKCKEWIIKYMASLPIGTFGNLNKLEVKNLTEKILNTINLDSTKNPFLWENNPGFGKNANKCITALLKILESFFDTKMTPQSGKLKLEKWQQSSLKNKLTNSEKIILSGAGAVSRYSLAFWLINGVDSDFSGITIEKKPKKCKKEVEIPTSARDVMGAIMGGLIGFGLGGPSGAIVGVVAGGTLASAA